MSNEYIVINTKKNDSTIWNTIASTYTPSAGEVCVIVPSGGAFDYEVAGTYEDMVTRDPSKSTIGIRIGDGKTVFSELPTLTDVSKIHPDWHETDPTSPNYIWHKPLTNSDIFITSGVSTLVFTDEDLRKALENKSNVRIFHAEEYCFLKDLNSGNAFMHPEDLLIEEDNTWGHYDVIYNKTETNHEPRYFYRNNIATQIESIKNIETDSGYRYRLETLLDELILTVLKKDITSKEYLTRSYVEMFTTTLKKIESKDDVIIPSDISDSEIVALTNKLYNIEGTKDYYELSINIFDTPPTANWKQIKYYEFSEIQNYAWLISNAIADYLVKHNGSFERSTIYTKCKEQLVRADNPSIQLTEELASLIRIFSNAIYELMTKGANRNNIEKALQESIYYYYEINNELLIDGFRNHLYIKKSRLQHFYNQAHGTTSTYVDLEPETPGINIPFEILDSYKFGKEYIVRLESNSVAWSGTFPTSVSEINYPVKEGFGVLVPKEEAKLITIDIDVEGASIVARTYGEGSTFPIKELPAHSDFNPLEEYVVKLYKQPESIKWEQKVSKENLPLKDLSIDSRINLETDLNKTIIKMFYEDSVIGWTEKTLKYLEDFDLITTIDEAGNSKKIARLYEPITVSCDIKYETMYDKIELFYTEQENTVPGSTPFILDESSWILEGEQGTIIYERKPLDRPLRLEYAANEAEANKSDTSYVYWVDGDATTGFKIYFKKSLPPHSIVNIVKSQNIIISEDNINKETGWITFPEKLSIACRIYFIKNSLADGELQIHIPYRTRRIKTSYISEYRGNWLTNNPDVASYILNRPFYIDDDGLVGMYDANGEFKKNGATGYYEYFSQFMKEIINEVVDDDGLADLSIRVAALEAWRAQVDAYLDKLRNYTKTDKNGNTYGGQNTGNDSESGVIKALDQLVDKVGDISQTTAELVNLIHIGDSSPSSPYCKVWINTSKENGNGLLYYYHPVEKIWKPISALWSPPDSSENIS